MGKIFPGLNCSNTRLLAHEVGLRKNKREFEEEHRRFRQQRRYP
jgi:hypothetical protein